MTRASTGGINCTSCGAGLDVLGGGRVQAHICGYCGAELDAQDDYKVLAKYRDLKRPNSPLQIGMSGNIDGVKFTVIGTLGLEERYHGRTWTWVDHQIFSPTHGYGYLTVEDGHIILSRRFRKPTRPEWLSSRVVERAESAPVVMAGGVRYRYYETSDNTITFAEGEFNWAPKIGESSRVISALSSDAMLSFSKTETEQEIERSTYLPQAETWASFGVTDPPEPVGQHPLQPFEAMRDAGFLKMAAGLCLVVCLFLSGYFATTGSTNFEAQGYRIRSLPLEIALPVSEPGKLAKLRIAGDVQNSWAYFETTLLDPEDVPVFAAGREIGYYTGRDSEGAWTEGSRAATLKFRPKMAGTYTLELELGETGLWSRNSGSALSVVSVEMSEGHSSPLWTLLAALGFAILMGVPFLRMALHGRRRWAGSDWVEEDDD